jgi:hypothetical protein
MMMNQFFNSNSDILHLENLNECTEAEIGQGKSGVT